MANKIHDLNNLLTLPHKITKNQIIQKVSSAQVVFNATTEARADSK